MSGLVVTSHTRVSCSRRLGGRVELRCQVIHRISPVSASFKFTSGTAKASVQETPWQISAPHAPRSLGTPQVAILNTIELLVATMQFVALSAVVGGPAAMSGMGEGGVAAMAILAGLAAKMAARAVLCLWFGIDPRTLRML